MDFDSYPMSEIMGEIFIVLSEEFASLCVEISVFHPDFSISHTFVSHVLEEIVVLFLFCTRRGRENNPGHIRTISVIYASEVEEDLISLHEPPLSTVRMVRNGSFLGEGNNRFETLASGSKPDMLYLHEGSNLKFGHPEPHLAQNTLKCLQIYLLRSPYGPDFFIRLHSPQIRNNPLSSFDSLHPEFFECVLLFESCVRPINL